MHYIKKYSSSLLLLLYILNLFTEKSSSITIAGITSSFDDIKNFISGINTIISGISDIAGTLGFSTIILFMGILIISAGLSAIGIPRGKISFIISLLAADFLWIFFKKSFNPESISYMVPVIKSNVIIILPLLTIFIIKKLNPKIFRPLFDTARDLFRRDSAVDRKEILVHSRDLSVISQEVQHDLFEQLLQKDHAKGIIISSEVRTKLERMNNIISRLMKK